MKIAVTYENGEIFGHFGHTKQFKVYETENGKILSSKVVDTNGSGHGALAGMLSSLNVGAVMIIGVTATKSENEYISAFGFAVAMVGVARIIQYLKITKNEESIKKQKINETDERNLSIIQRAKSATFSIYLLISSAVVIITALIDMPDVAKWLGYSQFVLVIIYWICYFIYQKKS